VSSRFTLPSRRVGLLLAFTVALTACESSRNQQVQQATPEVVEEQPPTSKLLERHVRFLCEREEARDWTHTESLDEVAKYIAAELEAHGARVESQDFEVDERTYRNVRALFGPEQGERIVVGAHYDVCDELPGADDNASGVAALLEVGRALGQLELEAPIELVAFTLEEPPFFGGDSMGSAVHAAALEEQDVELRAMICLEMVGYFTDEPDSQDFPVENMKLLYPTTGNFIAVVGRPQDAEAVNLVHAAMSSASELPAVKLLAPAEIVGVDFSDHRNYWAQDYTALMITDTSFYRNDNYHTAGDTPETLDYERMAMVVEGVVAALTFEPEEPEPARVSEEGTSEE
jgi:Peptidase family M28